MKRNPTIAITTPRLDSVREMKYQPKALISIADESTPCVFKLGLPFLVLKKNPHFWGGLFWPPNDVKKTAAVGWLGSAPFTSHEVGPCGRGPTTRSSGDEN